MKKEIETLNLLLNNYIQSFGDRTAVFSVFYQPVIERTLDWYLTIWKLNWQSFRDKSKDKTEWFELYRMLREAIKKIGKRTISVNQYSFTVSFLKNLQKHIEANKEEKVESTGKTWYYRNYLYPVFFELLVDFVTMSDISERDFMWSQFPSNWKITQNGLRERQIFAVLSHDEFMPWAQGRINRSEEKEFDEPLDEIATNLFPEVDSETWEIILIFVFSGYSPETHVKSIVERKWTIGYPSTRNFIFGFEVPTTEGKPDEMLKKTMLQKQGEMEAEIAVKTQKAYELAILLFHEIFSRELLTKYIEEAVRLKCPEKSFENHRLKLLRIFNGLLGYVNR